MAITLHIDEAKGLTSFNITGSLSFVELLNEVDAFYDHRPTPHALLNFLDVDIIRFNSMHVIRLAEYYPRYESNGEVGKVAIVAKDVGHLRLARLFKEQSDLNGTPYPIMVFCNTDDACKWIDEPYQVSVHQPNCVTL